MKKIFSYLIIFFGAFFLSGCGDENFIVFSTQNPKYGINKEFAGTTFQKGERVYYAIVAPKGFREDLIKINLVKKDTKSEFWGFSNSKNRTVSTGGKNYYTDYFVLSESGFYIMQTFDMINLSKPIATGIFKIE